MKKIFLFLATAICLATSCEKDPEVITDTLNGEPFEISSSVVYNDYDHNELCVNLFTYENIWERYQNSSSSSFISFVGSNPGYDLIQFSLNKSNLGKTVKISSPLGASKNSELIRTRMCTIRHDISPLDPSTDGSLYVAYDSEKGQLEVKLVAADTKGNSVNVHFNAVATISEEPIWTGQ